MKSDLDAAPQSLLNLISSPASQAVGHKLWVPPAENGIVTCLFWMERHFSNMSNDDMDDNEKIIFKK